MCRIIKFEGSNFVLLNDPRNPRKYILKLTNRTVFTIATAARHLDILLRDLHVILIIAAEHVFSYRLLIEY